MQLLRLFKKPEISRQSVFITPGQIAPVKIASPLNQPDWDYNMADHWDEYGQAKENLLEALKEI